MKQVLDWCWKRLTCTFLGHSLDVDRIYDPAAKSVTSGYRCGRCGKTQRLAYRWQEIGDKNEKTGDRNGE